MDDIFESNEWVFSVVAGGPGYVAVGLENPDGGSSIGRVWTSVDGRVWMPQHTEMPNGYLEEISTFKGALYAFGHELSGNVGIGPATVWRSGDGVDWTQAAVIPGAKGHWKAVVTTDERLVAFSVSAVSGVTTWLSTDGAEWRQPNGIAPDDYETAVTLGHAVVVAGGVRDNHIGLAPSVSVDGGETWQDAPVESDYEVRPHFAVNNGVLVAGTSACCVLPGVPVGVALTSEDGLNWVAGEPLLSPVSAALPVPGGFLTLSDDGSTALSADGESWFSGPPMPPLEGNVIERYVWASGVGSTGVLFISADFRNAREYDRRLWFAPIEAFELSRWTSPVPLAEQLEVGTTYPASVDFCPYSIRMGGQVWLPSSGISLEPYAIADENAMVKVVDEDHALYTSDEGEEIPLEPVHPVTPDPDPGC